MMIMLSKEFCFLSLTCFAILLQWISQISFPRLVRNNTSASYSSFPVLFLPSFSPSSCNKTFERACQFIHSERKMTRSSHHHAFLCSPDLERILYTHKSTLASSRSPNVTYSTWSSHIYFLLPLYRPDTSVHASNVQVHCIHYIHKTNPSLDF